MALSFCSNFQSSNQKQDTQLTHDHDPLCFHDNLINPLFEFDDNEMFYSSDSCTNLLPYFSSYSCTNLLPYFSSSPSETLISPSPDIFPVQELEDSYHFYPKRQKSYGNDFPSSFNPSFFNGHVSNFDQVLLPEIPAPASAPVELPKFDVPEPAALTFNGGRTNYSESSVKNPSVSAQSIAARQRRRKITEKTQELGKLIPGGNKMNTADMLQAAFKYVKFLKAQVLFLENMESIKEIMKEDLHTIDDGLHILLTSSRIQEKLYSQEKCLVPRGFLETVANDQEIQSTHFSVDEFDQWFT